MEITSLWKRYRPLFLIGVALILILITYRICRINKAVEYWHGKYDYLYQETTELRKVVAENEESFTKNEAQYEAKINEYQGKIDSLSTIIAGQEQDLEKSTGKQADLEKAVAESKDDKEKIAALENAYASLKKDFSLALSAIKSHQERYFMLAEKYSLKDKEYEELKLVHQKVLVAYNKEIEFSKVAGKRISALQKQNTWLKIKGNAGIVIGAVVGGLYLYDSLKK